MQPKKADLTNAPAYVVVLEPGDERYWRSAIDEQCEVLFDLRASDG